MEKEEYEIAEERLLARTKDGKVVTMVKKGDVYHWVEGDKDGKNTKVLSTEFRADIPGDRIIKEQKSSTLFTELWPTPALAMYQFSQLLDKNGAAAKS